MGIDQQLNKPIRAEFQLIADWISPQSRVLDLGCGDGTLLTYLKQVRQIKGYGLEIDPNKNIQAIKAGLNVIQSNLNDDKLSDYFEKDAFDFVIMTQALQVISRPDILLDKMLALGKQSIITFPNFGYWKNRAQLFFEGKMPQNKLLPNTWYNTPNIHLCTFKDFESLCHDNHIKILDRAVVNRQHKSTLGMKTFPNWLGEIALYRISNSTNF